MGRIVFEFMVSPASDLSKWEQLKEFLIEEGATIILQESAGTDPRRVLMDATVEQDERDDMPSGSPPYVLLAVFPDEKELEEPVARLRELEGVGRVDIDAWRRMV